MTRGVELERALRAAGFRGRLAANEPLGPLTTWRLGGPAELLAQPEGRADIAHAIRFAAGRQLPWRVMGNGSNLLVRDAGVPGLVLRLRRVLDRVVIDGVSVEAGAGASFPAVARQAAALGLSGIEFGAGIPGTIGGAVVMNAGWHAFEIGNVVESVELVDEAGSIENRSAAQCEFGYRESAFRRNGSVIVSATLRLEQGNADEIGTRLERFAASRKENQPTEIPSCGSVFLKPEGDFAGRLIETAGLKGLRIGNMQVSPKHANFFVNLGGGTAEEALALVERVEDEVERRFGVRLIREFELW